MTTHILFDFFGTLVEYSASRTEQGYQRSFDVLRSAGSPLDYEAAYLGANSTGIRGLLVDPRCEAPIETLDRLNSILDLARFLEIDASE